LKNFQLFIKKINTSDFFKEEFEAILVSGKGLFPDTVWLFLVPINIAFIING